MYIIYTQIYISISYERQTFLKQCILVIYGISVILEFNHMKDNYDVK